MKEAIERRRHPRYRLGDGAMAVSANVPGHIQNISLCGISFVCMHSEDANQNGDAVDILDGQHGFFMEAIPSRVVSKKMLINGSSFSMIRMMQCSLEFMMLTKAQEVGLEAYVRRLSSLVNSL